MTMEWRQALVLFTYQDRHHMLLLAPVHALAK